ncbi:MAG: sodium:solute symporter, partial [Clostridia bacterium]|nr:sodium:solute symporter [Clostridia bacterium]
MLANVLAKGMFPAVLQSPINAGAFCMIAGLIIVPVVSLFTRKPDAALIDHVFSCYDRKVLVSVKDSIGENAEA